MSRMLPVVKICAPEKVYGFIPISDILFMNMVNNNPTFYTSNGVYRLANTFSSLKDCLVEAYTEEVFQITDRGVIVNINKIKKFDEEKMVLFFEKNKQYYATISETNKNKIIRLMEERRKK